MPRDLSVSVPLHGRRVVDARSGDERDLGDLAGVHLMVLMRHRH